MRLIIFSLLESWYVASKPVWGLPLYKIRRSVLTSSLKLSVLCERRDQDSYFWLAHCESWLQVSLRQSCRLVGMVAPRSRRLLYKSILLLVFGLIMWKGMNGVDSLGSNQECMISYKNSHSRVSQCVASIRKLGNRRSSEGLRSFKPSKGTYLFILIILAGNIGMNPGPGFQCGLCKKYCKAWIDSMNVMNAKTLPRLMLKTWWRRTLKN